MKSTSVAERRRPPRLASTDVLERLLYGSLPFFMSQLVDPGGQQLEVAAHHEEWCEQMVDSERLVLLAPRSHGKTTVAICHILWRAWRHGRDPRTAHRLSGPTGSYSVVVFSATHDQAVTLLSTLRDLVSANAWLFGRVGEASATSRRTRWSDRHVRFASGAEISTRAYRTSTRGLHPDLLVLDDILSDENSLSQHQRDLTWKYFVGTLLPMSPGRIVIVGSAIHQDDLLHRLAPRPDGSLVQRFEWIRYKAINPETETALWPSRHSYAEHIAFRADEPTVFSREYQNEPRDDAASMFPYELTQRALDAGAELTFVPTYARLADELIVLGADFAISEAAGADYTVILVAAVNMTSGHRRLLWAERHKGLDLSAQVALIVELCGRYPIVIGIVEDNGFQRWIHDALSAWPETAARIRGHTTGRSKADPVEGVPGLKIKLGANLWTLPSGDDESRRFGRILQAEMAAFGWTDGRLAGLGEHDDVVMALWFIELAIRRAIELLSAAQSEIVTAEDLGFKRVRISPELDAADELARLSDVLRAW